jgi:hypothetical protein
VGIEPIALILSVGAALENFPLENKNLFWFNVHKQNWASGLCLLGLFSTPSLAYFILFYQMPYSLKSNPMAKNLQ